MHTGFWKKDGYILRPAAFEDAEEYFANNFDPLDSEIARLTQSKANFTHDEVVGFFLQCQKAKDRFDFLLIDPTGKIIGESVLNEIDWEKGSSNFRIALFHPENFGQGLGSWMLEKTLWFAFTQAKLKRVCLSVFSFNPRALHVYEKAGFCREGMLLDPAGAEDEILMAISKDEWSRRCISTSQ